eukprot:4372908-Amphidinium_carterae.1
MLASSLGASSVSRAIGVEPTDATTHASSSASPSSTAEQNAGVHILQGIGHPCGLSGDAPNYSYAHNYHSNRI